MPDNLSQILHNPNRNHQQTVFAADIKNVEKSFPRGRSRVQALRDITICIRAGVVTGLIGPDGAGKTTLMRLMAGLLVPDRGQIKVLGFDTTTQSLKVQAAVSYMPQRFGLYEDLTVLENLNLYADLQGVPRKTRPQRFDQLLQMTGLPPFPSRLAGRLSGGMKQKLGIACTLVRWPELLLLDEATVGVDPLSRRELWTIIHRLVQEGGLSVILSTAYLDEAQRCHEVIMIHEGQLLGQGTPDSFTNQMRGRTYSASAPGVGKRRLQKRFSSSAGVVDAVVQADSVRLVMETAEPPQISWPHHDSEQLTIKPVNPRFEDSFIALLRERRQSTEKSIHPGPPVGDHYNHRTTQQAVIQVRDVERRFGTFYAVKEISFDVNRGEIFGLLGANGAGKSTTFRMLCGLLPANSGSLSVGGVDLRIAPAQARARIGYMAQRFSLYGNLSVRENLRFFGSVYGLAGQTRDRQVARVVEQFQLAPIAHVTSADLPLGYKQRLAMACAIMHEPEILFLDEPTAGVDPIARREFWGRINTLADSGVTVMITTHFMEEAEYCDRVAIMSDGKILTIGSPAEIRDMARCETNQNPSLEDAFVALIRAQQEQQKP